VYETRQLDVGGWVDVGSQRGLSMLFALLVKVIRSVAAAR